MGEDRRPNVAGKPLEQDSEASRESLSEEQLRLEAKSLKRRTSVDGHEKKPEKDAQG